MSVQRDRVLRALQTAGPQGVTAADFSGLHGTPDGGPPIMRVAARVMELRQAGHRIEQVGKRDRCAVYKLIPTHEPLPIVSGGSEPAGLFSPPPANAIHGLDAA